MKYAWSFCGVIVVIGLLAQGSSEKVQPLNESLVRQLGIILPTATFDETDMEREFRQILSKEPVDEAILLVEAFDSEKSWNLSEMGVDGESYDGWKVFYDDYKDSIPSAAELLKIRRDVAMRLRDNKGNVSLKVLEGENPYDLPICGQAFALAHMSIARANLPGFAHTLHFFLTTDSPIDETVAGCAFAELERRVSLPNTNVYLSIRHSPWFVVDSDYPVVLPFIKENKPPTKQEYEEALEWDCSNYDRGVHCSGGTRSNASSQSPKPE
jgi:hypothetical protein